MATYLFAYFCFYLIALFVFPTIKTYRQTGINPFRFNNESSAINFVGKAYKIIAGIAFLITALNAFIPASLPYTVPIQYIENQYVVWGGFILLHLSFIIIFAAQRTMANEWRMGIDEVNKVNLITKGLFGISRNPIFLGVIIAFIGLFLIIPNIGTALVLFSAFIVIQVQVRLEEDFLKKALGKEYIQYMESVNRWLL